MKLINFSNLFWLNISLIISLYFGIVTLVYAFSQPYIVQDDVRQHLMGLQHFIDNQLFPNDLIARYFQSVAPKGYQFLYWFLAQIGISPLIAVKVIPLFLGLITTFYFFKFFLYILPIPFGAFLATLTLNINIWMKDDLASGSPRAFVYSIFAAFLYYLVKRSLIPCMITVALQGLFFPQLVFLQITLLTVRLFRWQSNKLKLSKDRSNYLFWFWGILIAFLVLLPFIFHVSEFGSPLTATQMKAMPEYNAGGRLEYFGVNLLVLLFTSSAGFGLPLFPPFIWLGLGLPVINKNPITAEFKIIWQLFLASWMMFLLAYIFLFRFYFPGRYTYHGLRFAMAIATAIVILSIINYFTTLFKQKSYNQLNSKTIKFTITLIIIFCLLPGFTPSLFLRCQEWRIGKYPEIYQFFASKPQDIIVASLAPEATNIPPFSQRSVLFTTEYALPFHLIYYYQMVERAVDLIQAQYSSNLEDTKKMIEKYGVDYILLESNSFTPNYLLQQSWLVNSLFKDTILKTSLEKGQKSALFQVLEQCSVKKTEEFTILDAVCIKKVAF